MPYDEEDPPYANLVEPPAALDELARAVIGAAIEVHKELGPGLPEEAYQRAMESELRLRGIPFERQKRIVVTYKGEPVALAKIDLVVGGMLIVELKAVEAIAKIHVLQARTYMRILKQPLALLINFNVPVLKEGIRRVVETI
ncbi:MAG TPA: GxxExxY protein [Tepidisphaeraceae bacterium]|nr:GxxExxY protein [Tepidisphaeraceae bacterium]